MANTTLSIGHILDIMKQDTITTTYTGQPVLQVLSTKIIYGETIRCRIILSDGLHLCKNGLVSSQLAHMFGDLANNTVIKLTEHELLLHKDTKILLVRGFDVLKRGCDVEGPIGLPMPWEIVLQPTSEAAFSRAAPLMPPPSDTQLRGQGQSSCGAAAAMPTSSSSSSIGCGQWIRVRGRSATPTEPPAMPTSSSSSSIGCGQWIRVRGRSATPTEPPKAFDAHTVQTIASLTPAMTKWVIKARVTNKMAIRNWTNAKGEGRLFNVELRDASGAIRATIFTDLVDRYHEMLQVGRTYFVSQCTVKDANKQYSRLPHQFELTFNYRTVVIECIREE